MFEQGRRPSVPKPPEAETRRITAEAEEPTLSLPLHRFDGVELWGQVAWDEGSTRELMAYVQAVLVGHLEWTLYALSLFAGASADALLLLQRRGFGRGGFGGFGRRRRRGGLLGGLALFFLLGPIIALALVAYLVYALFSGVRRRR